jgi:hypothetical protein
VAGVHQSHPEHALRGPESQVDLLPKEATHTRLSQWVRQRMQAAGLPRPEKVRGLEGDADPGPCGHSLTQMCLLGVTSCMPTSSTKSIQCGGHHPNLLTRGFVLQAC